MVLPLLAVAAAAWLALIVAAPVLPVPIAGALYMVGSLICHQKPDRSFHLSAAQLPVCARCFGIYAGAALGAFAPVMLSSVRAWLNRSSPRALLVAGAVPTMLTLAFEWSGAWGGSNLVRSAAAVPLGVVVAFVVAQAAATLH